MICRNIYIYIHGIVRCYILFNTSNKWVFADLNDWQIAFAGDVDGSAGSCPFCRTLGSPKTGLVTLNIPKKRKIDIYDHV